jgi:endonuclease-3
MMIERRDRLRALLDSASMTSDDVARRSGKTKRAPLILDMLHETYEGGVVELDWTTPFELLVATVLSAAVDGQEGQRGHEGALRQVPGAADYLAVPEEELQTDIYVTGFYRQKTRSLRGLCQALLEQFDGEVPLSMAELITLPGVARKTANVVLSAPRPPSTSPIPTPASPSTRT